MQVLLSRSSFVYFSEAPAAAAGASSDTPAFVKVVAEVHRKQDDEDDDLDEIADADLGHDEEDVQEVEWEDKSAFCWSFK